jgi:hypothetical protein
MQPEGLAGAAANFFAKLLRLLDKQIGETHALAIAWQLKW